MKILTTDGSLFGEMEEKKLSNKPQKNVTRLTKMTKPICSNILGLLKKLARFNKSFTVKYFH